MSEFNRENNLGVWFDIPVADLERASNFYAKTLDIEVSKQQFNDVEFSVLEHNNGNGGCLIPRPEEIAPESGILVYFNVHGRLHAAVEQAESLGGKIVLPIHSIGPHGFRAIILDSEGNRLALHSEVDT